jgi:hypothetical protein
LNLLFLFFNKNIEVSSINFTQSTQDLKSLGTLQDTWCYKIGCEHCNQIIYILENTASFTTYFSDAISICTFIDNPVTINGNPNFADVLEFSKYSSIDHYYFLYRYTKEVNGTKKKDLFKMIDYYTEFKILEISEISEISQEQLELTIFVHNTKNFKKVGVMTLVDSWFDEKNCTLKRIGSSCKNEEMAEFDILLN